MILINYLYRNYHSIIRMLESLIINEIENVVLDISHEFEAGRREG